MGKKLIVSCIGSLALALVVLAVIFQSSVPIAKAPLETENNNNLITVGPGPAEKENSDPLVIEDLSFFDPLFNETVSADEPLKNETVTEPVVIPPPESNVSVTEPENRTIESLTMYSDNRRINIIDETGLRLWSYPLASCADKELLPNGNILATVAVVTGESYITEIDVSAKQEIWQISELDGLPLDFAHDTDYVGQLDGQDVFIVADTYNDRVVEFFRNGTTVWSWYASDFYNFSQPDRGGWSHLNDVDRLENGNTLISLKHFNLVVIVDESGVPVWEYGDYYNGSAVRRPHDPELTPDGNIIIADSENNRVIVVNMTTKQIVWKYAPNGNDFLGWVRDADVLPNGNILICDSAYVDGGRNIILEVDSETKQVVWQFNTSDFNYDADRLPLSDDLLTALRGST